MAMPRCETFEDETPVIEAIRGGDRSAFAELVGRHGGWVRAAVYGVLGRADALDDVTQQVWTTAWRRIKELRDPTRWRPWLYRLARNAAIDAGRQVTKRRARLEALPNDVSLPARGSVPDVAAMGDERHRTVLDAVRALPALYREPFVLRHLSGWGYAQIAEAMGLPVDTVETRLVRARRLLREALKEKVF